mmetsp:Transcript_24158/g.63804  ORF Transcript_24158/g.63804 Transcript_24158/m.63804 type:complete len:80 (-) Transcript_24158:76-315(-)
MSAAAVLRRHATRPNLRAHAVGWSARCRVQKMIHGSTRCVVADTRGGEDSAQRDLSRGVRATVLRARRCYVDAARVLSG